MLQQLRYPYAAFHWQSYLNTIIWINKRGKSPQLPSPFRRHSKPRFTTTTIDHYALPLFSKPKCYIS
ncbi:Hypp1402 [Branchiostoma lanceolatum]|uniref:Hypp1402 protein n=1 Tax=Branchiostoma lanceolatum TaxID=7740 RepID=A0A8J9ZHI0_BRALA|nr:Hypp1402 [Branchiostoma lanceolatum]